MKYRTVRPEMGHYFYTRNGMAAYMAYYFESGSPLPLTSRGPGYARAVGFVLNQETPIIWNTDGRFSAHANFREHDAWDLVEKITMETAFQYPRRKQRPITLPAEQMGMLL